VNTWGAGATVCIDYSVKDCNGALTNPVSQTFTIRKPDGTTAVIVPVNTGLGAYSAQIETAPGQEGQWWWSLVTEDPDTTDDDSFVVTRHAAMV